MICKSTVQTLHYTKIIFKITLLWSRGLHDKILSVECTVTLQPWNGFSDQFPHFYISNSGSIESDWFNLKTWAVFKYLALQVQLFV